jgi:hypothetical protein
MTFEEWDNALADLSIELDEAAEAMGIEMSEIAPTVRSSLSIKTFF